MDRLPMTNFHKKLWTVGALTLALDGLFSTMPGIIAATSFANLQLTPLIAASFVSNFAIGQLCGGLLMGFLTDVVGRRKIFFPGGQRDDLHLR